MCSTGQEQTIVKSTDIPREGRQTQQVLKGRKVLSSKVISFKNFKKEVIGQVVVVDTSDLKNSGCPCVTVTANLTKQGTKLIEDNNSANNNQGEEEEEATKRGHYIDSRSILTNKERLKKFWEKRMELEFKLRQQQLHQQQSNGTPLGMPLEKGAVVGLKADYGGNVEGKQGQQLKELVPQALDENNNSDSKGDKNITKNNDNKDSSDYAGHQAGILADNKGSMQQDAKDAETQPSDSEWRSLSPNVVEPNKNKNSLKTAENNMTRDDDKNKNKKEKEVSAELLCEKLRKYQANKGINKQGVFNNDSTKSVPSKKRDPMMKKNGSNTTIGETQLMSIDPTLCHPSSEEVALEETKNVDQNREENNCCGIKSLDCQVASFDEQEEQTCNEEFSSSNSSFGPMSISIPQDKDNSINSKQVSKTTSLIGSDEDEQNSTQSGSVLTVIATMDHQNGCEKVLSEEDSRQVQYDQASCENEQNSNHDPKEYHDDQDEDGSNIGVAFESLHFDNEIKSSKHEQVDEERLIAPSSPTISSNKWPTATATTNGHKFNSREVKSVCNFITNAISDATKQVENFMKSNGHTIRRVDDDEVNNNTNEEKKQQEISRVEDGIQRATFVQESGCSLTHDDEDSTASFNHSNHSTSNEADGNEDDVPKADLSSIFEANVRREIERFESNSMVKRSPGKNKIANKSGLTEWRIAEEIRLFNEREMELKRRFDGDRIVESQQVAPTGRSQQKQRQDTLKQPQQHESVVRFGKTLQIPKSAPTNLQIAQDISGSNHSVAPYLSRSIKLSTTSSGSSGMQKATTMISMHKFISSGGKRFVYTNNTSATTLGSSLVQQNYLTKSMSNLSTSSPISKESTQAPKAADYKAIDSLRSRETPNVEPGLTKKAIETFSRLNNESNNRGDSIQVNGVRQYQQQGFGHHQSSAVSSAEWKIQEELKEMRAREAELKSLRSQKYKAANVINNNKNNSRTSESMDASNSSMNRLASDNKCSSEFELGCNVFDGGDCVSAEAEPEEEEEGAGERVTAASQFETATMAAKLIPGSPDKLSFSSDSLYPIKQTIDTFRKLNSSQSNNSNQTVGMKTQQLKQIRGQQHQQRKSDDHMSVVARGPV